MNKFQREDKEYSILPDFRLFPEQNEAVDFILSRFNCIVALQAGLGKCVQGHTRVLTNKGYLPIREISSVREEGFTPLKITVGTRNGPRETSDFFYKKKDTVRVLSLSDGTQINGTLEHPVLKLCKEGPRLVRIGEIQDGDILLKDVNQSHWDVVERSELTNEECYLIGLWLGDGCSSVDTPCNKIRYSVEGEEIVIRWLKKKFKNKLCRVLPTGHNTWRAYIQESFACKFREWFPGKQDSATKSVPEIIFRSSCEQKKWFIAGLLDSDGTFSGNTLEWVTKSESLCRGLREVLESLGILSRVSVKTLRTGPYAGRSYYRLRVHSEYYSNLVLDHSVSRKLKALSEFCAQATTVNATDYIEVTSEWVEFHKKELDESSLHCEGRFHCYRQIYRDMVGKGRRRFSKAVIRKWGKVAQCLVELLDYSPVKVVDKVDVEDEVFDITVPDGHEFLAQGLPNHNSLCALHAAYHIMAQSKSAITVIICPKAATSAFMKEFRRLKFKYSICTTDYQSFEKGSQFYLFNYSRLDSALKFIDKAKKADLKILGIFDEAHQISSEDSQMAVKLRAVRGWFSAVVAMTATPLLNDIMGTYRLVDFIRPGYFGNVYQFRDRYLVQQQKVIRVRGGRSRKTTEIVGYKNLPELRERLSHLAIVKRLKYNINFIYKTCQLDETEKALYNKASSGIIDELVTADTAGKTKVFSARLHDLQRVADGTHEAYPKGVCYSKTKLLLRTLREICSRGEGALVYTEYESSYETYYYWIKRYQKEIGCKNIYLITGKVAQEERVRVEKYLAAGDVVVLTKAGCQSINLQAVNNFIMVDVSFALGWVIQGIGRICRMDSKYDHQNVYFLEVEDTIDTYKRKLVEMHSQLIAALFGAETTLPELRYDDNQDFASFRTELKRKFLWRKKH